MMFKAKGHRNSLFGGVWFSLPWVFAAIFTMFIAFQALGADMGIKSPAGKTDPATRPFWLEAYTDFPDDALIKPVAITPSHLDAMMQRLKELGVRRVSWGYSGDGHGGMLNPTEYDGGGGRNWKMYDA